jgi:hypothetical protein
MFRNCIVFTGFLYCFVYVYLFVFDISVRLRELLPPSELTVIITSGKSETVIEVFSDNAKSSKSYHYVRQK